MGAVDAERAWAAGFFDGEGCCSLRRSKGSLHISITIGQADPEVLEHFCSVVGAGAVTGPYESERGHRDIWHYQCADLGAVLTVLGAIWPWLGSVKREQARRSVVEYTAWYRSTYPDWRRGVPPSRPTQFPPGPAYTVV
jgi:hypothetical protein